MTFLALAPEPIERIAADLAVVPLFDGERPLVDAAGRIDWRLCGRLSHLCADGRGLGAVGAALLTPGGGGVRAPRVLALGLGAREDLDAECFEGWVDDVLVRVAGLGAARAVVALPRSGESLVERLGVWASALVRSEADVAVLLAPEESDEHGVAAWLRANAVRARARGLEIEPPGPARAPQGEARPPEPDVSSHELARRSTR